MIGPFCFGGLTALAKLIAGSHLLALYVASTID